MLSRVAEAIYWMNRYLERAENTARFLEVNLHLTVDLSHDSASLWRPMIAASGDEELFFSRYDAPGTRQVIQFFTGDPQNPNAILNCLARARQNARTVREVISLEMWEQLNRYYLSIEEAVEHQQPHRRPAVFFEAIREGAHLFYGLSDATMSRTDTWHFLHMGRMLERASQAVRLLTGSFYRFHPEAETSLDQEEILCWASVLKSASALESFRKNYQSIRPEYVTEFLVLNDCSPHAIRFAIEQVGEALHTIWQSGPQPNDTRVSAALERLRLDLAFMEIEDIWPFGISLFLEKMQQALQRIDRDLHRVFFQVSDQPVTRPNLTGSEA